MDGFSENWQDILIGFGVTVEMALVAGIIAFLLGSLLAALRVSPIPAGRAIGAIYVQLVRNTPLLLVMLISTFALPILGVKPEINMNAWFGLADRHTLLDFDFFFLSASVALGLYTASFVCEAVRSGINAIPLGQAEAARSVGMTFTQTLRHIVLPQAIRTVVPPLTSIYIAMTKNTSVAVGVGVTEATFQMKKLNNDYSNEIVLNFIGFAVGYMILVAIISSIGSALERRMAVA